MFGLMKARACALDDDAKELRRLQYCGTCKTLGSLYGQRSRLLLNHDTVFLGEVLSALSEDVHGDAAWDPSIVSRNCLALPAKDATRTSPLAFAAAATVVLAEAKLADHAADSGQLRWRLAQNLYSRSFADASRWLREHGFPIDDVLATLAGQSEREARVGGRSSEGSPEESLASLAEPTALATGAFFAHGARFAGRPEAEEPLRMLGHAFGSLAYRLDALEDDERDAKTGEFNAYRAVLGGRGPLSAQDAVAIRQQIWSLGVEVCDLIRRLPIPPARAELFAERLRTNLSSRLGLAPKQAACSCVSALRNPEAAEGAVPAPVRVHSWRDSAAFLLNLPFLASAISGLSAPLYFSASGGGPEAAGEAVKHAKNAGGGSKGGGGGCDCCDACDCGDCCCACDC